MQAKVLFGRRTEGRVVVPAAGAAFLFVLYLSVFLLDESGVIRYRHIETLALFRRHREELLEVIEGLS